MQTITGTQAVASASTGRWTAFAALLPLALRAHAPLYVLEAAHLAFAVALVAVTPGLEPPGLLTLALSFAAFIGVILPLSLLSLRFWHVATVTRPKHPIPALARDVWDFVREPGRAANGLSIVLVFVVFMDVFAHIKGSIPVIRPFTWDATFMEWDRWLHFGRHPWELLQPVFGYPAATFLITGAYHLWFMVMWIMVSGLAFARAPSAMRMQFFLAFMLTWGVGGNALAILFSSAGPCYYGPIGLEPDPFAPLMSYLHSVHEMVPLWAVDTQAMLWQGYQGEGLRLGISAMPSMHNAAILLFALAGWRLNRRLGMLLYASTALIFLGSVHLGWHYAIDAYAGWAVALAAWWLSGLFARWWDGTPWAREYARAAAQYGKTGRPADRT